MEGTQRLRVIVSVEATPSFSDLDGKRFRFTVTAMGEVEIYAGY